MPNVLGSLILIGTVVHLGLLFAFHLFKKRLTFISFLKYSISSPIGIDLQECSIFSCSDSQNSTKASTVVIVVLFAQSLQHATELIAVSRFGKWIIMLALCFSALLLTVLSLVHSDSPNESFEDDTDWFSTSSSLVLSASSSL